MSVTASELTPADIAAVTNGNNNSWDNGGAWWLIVLFLFCFMGWGGNAWNNSGQAAPYVANAITQGDMQSGFDHAAVVNSLNGINASVNNGFANAEVSRCNTQANVLQTLNANQANTLQSMNANQTNLIQTLNANQANLSNQLNTIALNQQNCCCENRAAVADLKYTAANEASSTRNTVDSALHDIITNQTAGTQAILDKLCQQEIDQKNDTIANLRTQLNMANLASSQNAQTGQLMADNANQTQNLINQLRTPSPVPAYVVSNPYGCNCGTSCCG